MVCDRFPLMELWLTFVLVHGIMDCKVMEEAKTGKRKVEHFDIY